MELIDRLSAALAGRYEIEREIGRGGMAMVYLARDLKLERRVAVKVLRPELSASLLADRFLREIRIAAQLQHPLIIPLYDSGAADGLVWYVMPYVEGETLRARLNREKQLRLDEALRIARDTAEALSDAHEHGFIHRDIKPENILLTGDHALVADFGVARALTAAGGVQVTSSGVVLGTPAYMSPEQATGEPEIDPRSDVYALGCVLYEMLAGEPPFTGATPQAIIARHISQPPPSLRVVRSSVPPGVERVVGKALAKVPADRFATAQEFSLALQRAGHSGSGPASVPRLIGRRQLMLAAVIAALFGFLVWRGGVAARSELDAGRVVVYPLAARSGADGAARFGEDVATAVLTALNSTEHLEATDGWRLLNAGQRNDPRLVTERHIARISRRAQARFAVDGWLLVSDSIRGVVRLHDLAGDSIIRITFALASPADAWTVGLRAAMALLPTLIPAGEPVDLSALSDRSLAAAARFLKGEQAYRRARFTEALDHYRGAVAADSGFAMAAVRGAQLASWNRRDPEATELIRIALAHEALLAPRDRHLARGVEAYVAGRADSAVRHLRRAIDVAPQWPEAWMQLGEVYTHWLPSDPSLDSLAEAAFTQVHRLDSTFAPVLYHLMEIALRKRDVREATRLMRQFRQGEPDSAEVVPTEIMLTCVRDSPGEGDWRGLARRVPQWVVDAGRALAVAGLRQPRCAEAAWRAILAHDTATGANGRARRWGALSGLQGILVAQGRTEDLRRLLRSDTVLGPEFVARLYILSALAGAAVDQEAEEAVAELRKAYEADAAGTVSVQLWHIGIWEAHRGRWAEARVIADTLAARAVRNGTRRDALMAKSVAARAALARGDSAAALELLLALAPDTVRAPLTWQPWESLGGERLLLARLRFARGELADAYRVAASLDAPAPVPYVMYLPASVELRMRAAEALGNSRAADAMRRRLLALGRSDILR